jgi:hypothetical protein
MGDVSEGIQNTEFGSPQEGQKKKKGLAQTRKVKPDNRSSVMGDR